MANTGSGHGRDESTIERADRQFSELLQELRVAQAGVQILFAFLLVIPFQSAFDQVPQEMQYVHAASLVSALAAAAFLIAPVALHRILFRQQMKPEVIEFAHRMALTGLVFLALAMSGAMLLSLDATLGRGPALTASIGSLVLFTGLWFALPVTLRLRDDD